MGGLWSGTRGSKKRLVEECHALDAADLKRLRLLTSGGAGQGGTLRWMSKDGKTQESAVEYVISLGVTTGIPDLKYTVVATG